MNHDYDADMLEVFESETPKMRKKPSDAHYYQKLAESFLEQSDYGLRCMQNRDYTYTGTHWEEIDDISNRLRIWMIKNNIAVNNTIVGNTIPILRAITSVVGVKTMPTWIGSQCPFKSVKDAISFDNGIMDVTQYLKGNAELILHSRDWFSTFCLPFGFDKDAKCETWLSFLSQVYEGDAERIALLQKWFGYCLTPDTSYQKLLMICGQPRSGKGTIQTMLSAVVGKPNQTGFSLTSLASDFGMHSLLNKLVAVVGEVNLAGNQYRSMILERLKSITGEDQMDVAEKFKSSISTVIGARFCVSCNGVPTFIDPSGALGKRLLVLDHNVSFAGKEDYSLKGKLELELPGVAIWALEGLKRLRKNGYSAAPKTMQNSLN